MLFVPGFCFDWWLLGVCCVFGVLLRGGWLYCFGVGVGWLCFNLVTGVVNLRFDVGWLYLGCVLIWVLSFCRIDALCYWLVVGCVVWGV